jgi:hypothetical protein
MMVEKAGTGITQHLGDSKMSRPEHAPMHDGCSRIARNLETNRPMFEGVDTASLEDMATYANQEIQNRDISRPDLEALNKLLEEACGVSPHMEAPF